MDETLRRLDAQAAGALEKLVRDALELAVSGNEVVNGRPAVIGAENAQMGHSVDVVVQPGDKLAEPIAVNALAHSNQPMEKTNASVGGGVPSLLLLRHLIFRALAAG